MARWHAGERHLHLSEGSELLSLYRGVSKKCNVKKSLLLAGHKCFQLIFCSILINRVSMQLNVEQRA